MSDPVHLFVPTFRIDEVLGEIRAFEAQSKKLLNGRRRRRRAAGRARTD